MRKICLIKPGRTVQVKATDGLVYTGTLLRPAAGTHGRAMMVRFDDVGPGIYRGSTAAWAAGRITPAFR